MEQARVKVCILNMRGQPLMPCTPVKARKLLRDKKAIVKFIKPFTIQLTVASGEQRTPIAPSDDPGYYYKGLRVAPTAAGDSEPQLEPVPCTPRPHKPRPAQPRHAQPRPAQSSSAQPSSAERTARRGQRCHSKPGQGEPNQGKHGQRQGKPNQGKHGQRQGKPTQGKPGQGKHRRAQHAAPTQSVRPN